ncbi:MAG: Gfo/Idh/MocA family oxidoreductase [Cyclobacteriaceae bacterium]
MNKVRFGIIGLGSVSTHHIKSLIESSVCELSAVCSRSEFKLRDAKANYQVETFTAFHDMVNSDLIDAVIICTPSGFHLEPTLAAAKAGKHVLVEKPLEISVDRANRMIKVCNEANVRLSCIFQNRFSDDFQKALKAVRDGQVGQLILGNAYIKWFRDQQYYDSVDWRGTLNGDGGAALINQSIHTIDLLLQVMGPVKSVFGKVKTLARNIEGEDIGTATLEFKNGAIGTIEGSTVIYKGYPEKLEIHGTKGNIILEAGKITQWQCQNSEMDIAPSTSVGSGSSDPTAIGHLLHMKQIETFAQEVMQESNSSVDGASAIHALKVISAIYESSKSGKEIHFD